MDKLENRVLTSIKSHDLTAKTLQENGLYTTVKKVNDELIKFTTGSRS